MSVIETPEDYQAFWNYWLKLAVVLLCVWGAVLEGTLLSLVAVSGPLPAPAPCVPLLGASLSSAQIHAPDAAGRSLALAASLMPSAAASMPSQSLSETAMDRAEWSDRNR